MTERRISIRKFHSIKNEPALLVVDRLYDIVEKVEGCEAALRGINISFERKMRMGVLPDIIVTKYEIFYFYPTAPGNELKIKVTWESDKQGHLLVEESNFCKDEFCDELGLEKNIDFELRPATTQPELNSALAYALLKAIDVCLGRANAQVGGELKESEKQEAGLKEVGRDWFTIS